VVPGPVALREATRVWIRVAALSFGGPAAQIAVIHRLVVDEKRWVSEQRFLHALSYCMLLPGPEAQQLATYLGWLLHGTSGGLIAGILFVVPGFLAILGLSLLYVTARDAFLVSAIFSGLKPAVIAVVFEAVLRLRRRALGSRASVAIATSAFLAVFAFQVRFPLVVAAAALLGWAVFRHDALEAEPVAESATYPPISQTARTAGLWLAIWLVPVLFLVAWYGVDHVVAREALFFSKVAVVTFGGAYAVLAYVAQQAVEVYGWLVPGEMLDGLALAETTPGPLIMVVQFVGFLGAYREAGFGSPVLAGFVGSAVTAWVTFAPCFLFILAGAPYVEVLRGNRPLSAALKGIMAAVVGVVVNLGVWFATHTLFGSVGTAGWGPVSLPAPAVASINPGPLVIAVASFVAMTRLKVGLGWVLVGAAAAGVALNLAAG